MMMLVCSYERVFNQPIHDVFYHVNIHAYMQACDARAHTHVHGVHTCMHTYAHICIHAKSDGYRARSAFKLLKLGESYTCTHTHTNRHTYVHTTYMHTHTNIRTYIHTGQVSRLQSALCSQTSGTRWIIHIYTHTHTQTNIDRFIHTHTHIRACIHTHRPSLMATERARHSSFSS